MMKLSFFKSKKLISILLILSLTISVLVAETKKYTVGATKFTFARNQTDSVSTGTATMLPARILEKLSTNLYRTINEDEKYIRELNTLKKERLSLVLQLSKEIQKRDAVVLSNANTLDYNKNLKAAEKKVADIKKSIDENIQKQKDIEKQQIEYEGQIQLSEAIKSKAEENKKTIMKEYGDFFKNFFVRSEKPLEPEQIVLYKDSFTSLYSPSEESLRAGYNSYQMETEAVKSNINALITGEVNSFDEYFTVTVDLYTYPGAKNICTITEVGSISEADYICTIISQQLIPHLTNAIPVQLYFEVLNTDIPVEMYIDDVLHATIPEQLTISSGIHYIQFSSPGYKTIETTYNFKGNGIYKIDVNLEEESNGKIYLGIRSPLDGKIYVNGSENSVDENGKTGIQINGNSVLGQYIADSEKSAFFYVASKHMIENNNVSVKVKPINRSDYIDTRRKWMYGSYSALICSLIPTFVCLGQVNAYTNAYNLQYMQDSNEIKKANQWILASNITKGISAGCGAWFAYELVRYFIAANSVLPAEAKKSKE